jgi:hypothetical protein
MAEGDGVVYNNFKEQILLGELDLGNAADTIKVILVTGHTPNIDTHVSYSDVSGDEESGSGYTAGGETLANQAVLQENSTDRASFDADDVTWTALNVGTPSHAIAYDSTHVSDYLIAYWEVTTASNGGDYTLQWHANGILLLT